MATTDATADITTGSIAPSQDLAASKLIGATVYASDDSNIGEVGDIVFDKKGDINAIIVDVGGFLGIGEKPVALSFDKLNMRTDENGNITLVANASKDELNNAPAYEATVQ
jgi:sporulation protein YlmC with PRC-barrel domain